MKTRLVWKECPVNKNKDSFFVECTEEDVVNRILPHLKGQNSEMVQTISKARGHSLINEAEDEKDIAITF